MPSQTANIELAKLEPSAIVELFELDGTPVGMSPTILRFHAGTNALHTNIIFDGEEYVAFPLKLEGFEYDGKGSLPRPTIIIANINGLFSSYLRQYKNFIGCKVTRKRTFVRFLDNANFPNSLNPYGTPSSEVIGSDEFYVFQKKKETNDFIEFELASQLELAETTLPSRKMLAGICSAKYYRDGIICPYAGVPVADKNNKTFLTNSLGGPSYGLSSLTAASPLEWSATSYSSGTYVTKQLVDVRFQGITVYYVAIDNVTASDVPGSSSKWVADSCSKSILGCKNRFLTGALPFGGFPGIARYPIVG